MSGVRRRWICVGLSGAVGGAFAHLAWHMNMAFPTDPVINRTTHLPAICQYFLVLMAGVAIGFLAVKHCPIGGVQWVRSNRRYPSIWVAILLSLAFFVAFLPLVALSRFTSADFWSDFAIVVLSFLVLPTFSVAFNCLNEPSRTSPAATPLPRSQAALDSNPKWWHTDDSIEHAANDRFGFTAVVDRLVAHYQSGRDFSLLLDGPFGSGKSSALAMASTRVGSQDNVVLCRVSCWDFPSSAEVIQYILTSALSSLQTHFDVTAFRGLPLQYGRAVFGSNAWFSLLINLFELAIPDFQRSPSMLITHINRALTLVDLRLVITIEDLDRTGIDNEHMQPVFALLFHFREADRISLIVAGSSEDGFDPDSRKLFDFVETISDIDAESLNRELATFETLIRKPTSARVVSDDDMRPLLYLIPQARQALDGYDYPLDAMRRLVRTPRSFKQLLRETEADWTRLAGEVDFDELIIANTLRLFAPSAFWFVDEYRSPRLNGPTNKKDQDTWVRRRVSAWEQKASGGQIGKSFSDEAWILAMVLLGISRSTARLLPGDDEPTGPRYSESSAPNGRPQSILTPDFGDEYWRRIRNRDLGNSPVRDQDLLRLDKDSQSDPSRRRELAAALVGDGVAVKRWRRLSDGRPVTAALELADVVIDELRSSSAESRRFEALAIVRPRVQSRSHTEDEKSQIYEWLKRTSIESAHCDWGVMSCLLDRWAQGLTGQDQLVSGDARKDLLKHVQTTVAEALRSGKLRLIDCLRPTEEWSALAGVVSIAGTSIAHITGLVSSGHEWIRELAEAIFEEAQQAPTKWTGHLIVLFWGVNGIQAAKDWAVPAFGVDICRRAFSWISEQPIEHKSFCTGMWDWDRDRIHGEEVLQQARAWLEKDAESNQ